MMEKLRLISVLLLTIIISSGFASGFNNAITEKDEVLAKKMSAAVNTFIKTLNPEQKNVAVTDFENNVRFDWHYIPRERKGLTLKKMKPEQRAAAMAIVHLMMSREGYQKTEAIIDLENVLRVVENRPPNDTYRDPENFAFLIYGNPGNDPWGWSVEGHHLSLHFTSMNGQIAFMPGFMGSNPGKVLAEVPQKGKRILADEQDIAFELLHSLNAAQLKTVLLGTESPNEIFTANSRKASLEKMQGLAMKDMNAEQQAVFKKLIRIYLQRYHITLKNQQWTELEKAGLDQIHFAWMGDQQAEIGAGHGQYYRIHGPTFLIEFDNTQNGGNHIHSVVRDLKNDFGEDMLREHYAKKHR
ncbi:DUF3500 domain-containing protein [Dyadobacter sp. NIV53]|uniref:DUF3500 domain-containing protein n=1 Tax=Dyadobacter sp. NIV53 TaxID=2861765 RepID=UPI001E39787F|nr:DUF3500 domain-containing protein [Dyadobacter sp. NIV53]